MLFQAIQQHFTPDDTFEPINSGHGRIEKRKVTISPACLNLPDWLEMTTIIRVESQRQTKDKREFRTRYYISDLKETAFEFYQRIRGYWGVENRVHYVRDVTQGEDKSRIRTTPLPQIRAIARKKRD